MLLMNSVLFSSCLILFQWITNSFDFWFQKLSHSRAEPLICVPELNGCLDTDEAPPGVNYGRRRSRAVLYQLSGHYTKDKPKHTKLKLNNVSNVSTQSFVQIRVQPPPTRILLPLFLTLTTYTIIIAQPSVKFHNSFLHISTRIFSRFI